MIPHQLDELERALVGVTPNPDPEILGEHGAGCYIVYGLDDLCPGEFVPNQIAEFSNYKDAQFYLATRAALPALITDYRAALREIVLLRSTGGKNARSRRYIRRIGKIDNEKAVQAVTVKFEACRAELSAALVKIKEQKEEIDRLRAAMAHDHFELRRLSGARIELFDALMAYFGVFFLTTGITLLVAFIWYSWK